MTTSEVPIPTNLVISSHLFVTLIYNFYAYDNILFTITVRFPIIKAEKMTFILNHSSRNFISIANDSKSIFKKSRNDWDYEIKSIILKSQKCLWLNNGKWNIQPLTRAEVNGAKRAIV